MYSIFQKTVEKISMSPQLAKQIYELYGGKRYPRLTEEESSSNQTVLSKHPLNVSMDIEPGRIQAICSQNTFKHPIHPDVSEKFDSEEEQSCLHIFPSYFNHSCIPNAKHVAFPDVLVIRALRTIEEGEEVFLNYGPTGANLKERSLHLSERFGACDCQLCRADRDTPSTQARQRQGLLAEIKSPNASLEDIKQNVKEIDATFPEDYPRLRWEAFLAHRHLAQKLEELREETKESSLCAEVIQSNISALEALGTLVIEKSVTSGPSQQEVECESLPISVDQVPYEIGEAVTMCLEICRCFKIIGMDNQAKQWLRAAMWSKPIIWSCI
jgi:hypothetical protein